MGSDAKDEAQVLLEWQEGIGAAIQEWQMGEMMGAPNLCSAGIHDSKLFVSPIRHLSELTHFRCVRCGAYQGD